MLTAISVLCHVTTGSNDHLKPARDAVTQLFQAISAELHGPQLLDGGDELGHRGDILLFQEFLHMVPAIFYWFEVRAVAGPIYHLERLLSQESLDPLRDVARCTVLQKVCAAMEL